jgi:hypothetical protein
MALLPGAIGKRLHTHQWLALAAITVTLILTGGADQLSAGGFDAQRLVGLGCTLVATLMDSIMCVGPRPLATAHLTYRGTPHSGCMPHICHTARDAHDVPLHLSVHNGHTDEVFGWQSRR